MPRCVTRNAGSQSSATPSAVDEQPGEGAERAGGLRRNVRQPYDAMGHRQARLPPLELLVADRHPELVEDVGRIAAQLLEGQLEVLGPETEARLACHLRIMADDVHLGVVEERVLVQVRRADRQPAV